MTITPNIVSHVPKAEDGGGVWTEYWPLPVSESSTDVATLESELRDNTQ